MKMFSNSTRLYRGLRFVPVNVKHRHPVISRRLVDIGKDIGLATAGKLGATKTERARANKVTRISGIN